MALRYCSVSVPQDFRRSFLGLPPSSGEDFAGPMVFPPGFCRVLTALVGPLFKGNRVFSLFFFPCCPSASRIKILRALPDGPLYTMPLEFV